MASYTRLGSYLLADELTADPFGKIHRGLTIIGSTFDKHFLVRSFSEEVENSGLGEKVEEMNRVVANLAGTRGFPNNYHIEGGKTPLVASDQVPGRSLAQMIEKAKHEQIPLGVDHSLSVLQGLAQALIQLHSKGISHGILSPHSIWVSFEGATQLLDAPYAAVLSSLLAKCPVITASLARYRRVNANPLHQDLFSLGAILYELLTFEKLPAQDQIPTALAKATLKAAQEEAPIPQEILELLNRLLMVKQPFENAGAFGTELERVLYDGDYSPTTFNMAFFMHTLFREENELDNQAVKADQSADFAPYAVIDPGVYAGEGGMSAGTKKGLRLAAIGAVVVLGVVGFMGYWSAKQANEAKMALAEAKKMNEAKDLELQKLAQEQWLADQKAQQLAFEAKEAKDAQARADAQRALEQLQRDAEENRRRREEILKQKQVLQQKNPTMPQTQAPVAPPAPAPAPAVTPVLAPGSAASPAAQDTAPSIVKKATPVAPHPNKGALPAALQNTDINVTVKVFVDSQGRPLKVLIDKGVEGSFGYNESAREAALGSSYAPAMKGGKPATGWITLNYSFGRPQ
jgi:hypothetical protein